MFGNEHDHLKSKDLYRLPHRTFDRMNDDAFKLLFDEYKNRLYRYVLATTHSKYIAEEITQEIFIKLWLCRESACKQGQDKSIDFLQSNEWFQPRC